MHATDVIWRDPLNYDALRDGPPYFEGTGKVASSRAWVKEAHAAFGQDVSVAIQHCMAEYGNAPMSELAVVLACVRAEAMIHQAHHWQTRGQTYYGDHLLFERVYNEVNGFVDRLAERSVGAGQEVLVQPLMQMSHMVVFSKLFYSDAPVVPTSELYPLLSLRALLKSSLALQMAYASLEAKGQLSNGTDNLLQDIADKQEELVYLLKQRTKTKEAAMSTKNELESFKHEVLIRRVASRFVEAMEHSSPEAMREYLKDHPNADPSNHTVKKKEESKGEESKSEGAGEKKAPKKSKSNTSHPVVKSVMEQHDLKDEDADELLAFKKRKPNTDRSMTDLQLMQKFLREASPETKERMKGMSPKDFKKMLAAIMDEEGEG